MKKIFTKIVACVMLVVLTISTAVLGGCADFKDLWKHIESALKDYINQIKETPRETLELSGDFSMHFLMLGNEYAGDCVYIKAGENDILIDAGSRKSSVDTIEEYLDGYVQDDKLEFVIATHADQDHIAGFAKADGIFARYECETIIDFARSDKDTATYEDYIANRDAEVEAGAKHYTALECYKGEDGANRVYTLGDGIKMEILYNYYYDHDSSDENNYSVCLLFQHGDRYFLLTGDLEEEGEEYLVEFNNLPEVELFKAGHHGSKTSSNDVLLNVIMPKMSVVTCVAGTDEYTSTPENQFPTQKFIDRIAKHTDKVYCTTIGDKNYTDGADFAPMNGNVVVMSEQDKINVVCSNNDVLLKDTAWFKAKRETPSAWK